MTLLVLTIGAFAIAGAWVLSALALLAGTRASVSASADAAALAAADDLALGNAAAACTDAARIARANDVLLVECRLGPAGDTVRVVVVRTVAAPWAVTVRAGARASVDTARAP